MFKRISFILIFGVMSSSLSFAAKPKAKTKKTKVTKVTKGSSASSGADSTEGWIIKKTKDGVIKVPRKETFRFEGSDVSGSAQKPSQTVLGKRPEMRRASLIPERRSFKSDALRAAGAPVGGTQVFEQGN